MRAKKLLSFIMTFIIILGSFTFGFGDTSSSGDLTFTKTANKVSCNEWDITLTLAGGNQSLTSDTVLVIDRSGSMGNNSKLVKAKAAAVSFVEMIFDGEYAKNHRIAVVAYGDDVVTPVLDFSQNETAIKAAINGLRSSGGTHTQAAMKKAGELIDKSKADIQSIVLLSDGRATYSYEIDSPIQYDNNNLTTSSQSGYDYKTTVGDGNRNNHDYTPDGNPYEYRHGASAIQEAGYISNKVKIYTISVDNDTEGDWTLKNIASSGEFYGVSTSSLNAIYQKIAAKILHLTSDVKVIDPMGEYFDIPGINADNYKDHITVSAGTISWDNYTETIRWELGKVTGNPSMTYMVQMIPEGFGNGTHPTNGPTTVDYKDANGDSASEDFTVPKVEYICPLPEGSLGIDKTVALHGDDNYTDSIEITQGQTVEYRVIVTNEGQNPLYNIIIDDSMLPEPIKVEFLDVEESITEKYEKTFDDVALEPVVNTATASASNAESVNDNAYVTVKEAPTYILGIDKTVSKDNTNYADSVIIYEDDMVRYAVVVRNEGNMPLENVVISDNMLPAPINVGTLAVGQSTTKYYDKTFTDPTDGPVINTATASAMNAENVEDTARVTVNEKPTYILGIDKTVSKDNTNYSNSITVYEGATVKYKVVVTNEGNMPLENVVISDDMLAETINVGTLAVGQSSTRYYEKGFAEATDGPFTNTAVASATNADSDEDTADVTVEIKPDYALDIDKTVSKNNADYSDSVSVYEGDTVRYMVTVTNDGNMPLENVVISDDMLSAPINVGTIPIGQSSTEYYDKTFEEPTDGPVINTARASADNVSDESDTANVTVMVKTYGLTIEKTVDDSIVYKNQDVTYTVVIENTGNQGRWVDFRDYDDNKDEDERLDVYDGFYLDAGVTTSMAFTTSYSSTGDYTNTAQAIYYDGKESPVTVSDTAEVTVKNKPTKSSTDYGMSITKAADPDEVTIGDIITYTITVTNTEDGTLRNITVVDELVGLDENIEVLKENKSVTYEVTYEAQEVGILENTAVATDDKAGTEKASANVLVKDKPALGLPGLSIDKTIVGDKTEFFPGDMVEFNIVVTNTGNTVLKGIVVEDPMAELYGYEIEELDVGKSTEPILVSMVISENTENFTNTAKATVDEITVSDDADVKIGEIVEKDDYDITIPVEEETIPLDVPDTGAIPMMLIYGLGALGLGTGWSIIDRKKR